MLEKLDFLTRFWELKARHASLGEPLTQREQEELLSLLQLVGRDMSLPTNDVRSRIGLLARLAGDGETVHARIRDVTAGGLLVELAKPLIPPGSLVLFVTDAVRGVEYVLPCSLQSFSPRSNVAGLAPSGVPHKSHFDDDDDFGDESEIRDRSALLASLRRRSESGAA